MSLSEKPDRLDEAFYARPVLEVARALIGCRVLLNGVGGRIVETEAYHQDEAASHSHAGPTPRSQLLFGAPGLAYIYFNYGIHTMLNATAEPKGIGAGVLIRALEPTHAIETMQRNRGRSKLTELCSGPGKLTQALGIKMSDNGTSLIDGPIEFHAASSDDPEYQISESPRIGITKATELKWRFYADGVEYVSRTRATTN